jgi:hypothetical protein
LNPVTPRDYAGGFVAAVARKLASEASALINRFVVLIRA